MTIYERVRALGFPEGHFVVAGSAIMEAKGIRPAHDLDLVVSQELFDACRENGWTLMPWTRTGYEGKSWLKKGDTELMLELIGFTEKEVFSFEKLLKEAEIIEDLPFLTLERFCEFKREYGRPKDVEDVRLMEAYLASRE